jgi:hypothetical protein
MVRLGQGRTPPRGKLASLSHAGSREGSAALTAVGVDKTTTKGPSGGPYG